MQDNTIFIQFIQYNSSQMEYKNKIPKFDMLLKPRELKVAKENKVIPSIKFP